jgi:hypothetical protein
VLSLDRKVGDFATADVLVDGKTIAVPAGNDSSTSPYRPNFLGDCCHKGTNPAAPECVLRP